VNNDLFTGLLIASGLLMASRLLEEPGSRFALLLGLVVAAAVLAKGQGTVLLLLAVVAVALLARRRNLTPLMFALTFFPGLIAFLGWSIWTWNRYETLNGSEAYLDLVGAGHPLGLIDFVGELWLNGWSSYWGAYDGGTLRWVTGFIILAALVAGLVGLLTGPGAWWRQQDERDRLILTGVVLVGLLLAAWIANDSGLADPHGRMFIGVVPAVVTLTITGIRRLAGDVVAVQTGIAAVALSGVYFLYWYLPFFY
jgi:hypothetical protein